MKQLIQTFAILGMVILSFVSCKKEKVIEVPNEDFYTVQVNLAGEISVGYEPMTKSSANDLYAVQVHSTPNVELEDGVTPVWTPYAHYYCVGSAPTTIKLADGYKYKFDADLIVDGNNKLSLTFSTSGSCPWVIHSDVGQVHYMISSNSFNYCTTEVITIGGVGADLGYPETTRYNRPNIDRYMGFLGDFVPSASNMNASIEMKRVSFGAKFVVTGSLATSGTIGIEIEDAPKQTLTLSATPEDNIHYDIYALKGISMRDGYTETVPVTLNWTRTDGTVYSIGTFNIVYQRNTTTVVTIVLDDDTISGGMGLVIPESETGTMTEPGTNDVTIKDGAIQ